ncbi:MAG: hypothetical protein WBF12_11720, partial [Bradyrhizobium sp.]
KRAEIVRDINALDLSLAGNQIQEAASCACPDLSKHHRIAPLQSRRWMPAHIVARQMHSLSRARAQAICERAGRLHVSIATISIFVSGP